MASIMALYIILCSMAVCSGSQGLSSTDMPSNYTPDATFKTTTTENGTTPGDLWSNYTTAPPDGGQNIYNNGGERNDATEEPETTKPGNTNKPVFGLGIGGLSGIAVGIFVMGVLIALAIVFISRNRCQEKPPRPSLAQNSFESFRLMRSNANLLAVSESPKSNPGSRSRARKGSLMLPQPPDVATIYDFRHSILEKYQQAFMSGEKTGSLPEYIELIEGPDGLYAELTVEYDIKPSTEVYIPLAEREESQ